MSIWDRWTYRKARETSDHRDDAPSFGRLTPLELRYLAFSVVGLLVFLLFSIAFMSSYSLLASWWRGECDMRGRWVYHPTHQVDPQVLSALPHDDIHRDLVPRWATSAAHLLDDPFEEVRRFDELRAAVEPDPNLTALLEHQRQIILDRRILADAERLHYLVWAWNRYLDEADLPFMIQGNVGVSRARQPFFYVTSYRTYSDLPLSIGDRDCRVRLVGRIDAVNVRELHLGEVSNPDDGAVVVVDRLQEFALDAVWPLLAGEARFPPGTMMAAYAAPVISEVEAGIGPDHLEVLRRGAVWRSRMLDENHAIAEREYCSGFAITHTPFNGHSQATLDQFVLRTWISTGAPCPQIKIEEIITLYKGSEELRRLDGLRQAISALLAWVSRMVSTHEARHLADLDEEGELDLTCVECGPPGVTAEISAYLASFAWSDAPATAYYQACRAVVSERNPHAAAMETIGRWLDAECFEGPPERLSDRARGLESAYFGRSEPIVLPLEFPDRLPVVRSAGSRHHVVGPPQPDEG